MLCCVLVKYNYGGIVLNKYFNIITIYNFVYQCLTHDVRNKVTIGYKECSDMAVLYIYKTINNNSNCSSSLITLFTRFKGSVSNIVVASILPK